MAVANSMTVWQRLTSLWRTNNHPQTFLLLSTDCTDFTDFIFCVISVFCWLLSSKDTNYTKLLVSFVSFDDFLLSSNDTNCTKLFFRAIRWQDNYPLLNKLLSPESKTYELLQLTNNHRHYITFTYQKSKNPPKITTTIYIFRQFSFLPIFKTPRP